MAIMKPLPTILILLPLALSACGIPDMVATGVKAIEHEDERQKQLNKASAPPAPQPQPQPVYNDPPPPVYAPAPRDSITVEKLK